MGQDAVRGLCRESTEDCLSKDEKAAGNSDAQVFDASWQVVGSEAVPWSFPREAELVELPAPPLALLGKPHGGNLTFRSDVPLRDSSLDGSCKFSAAGSCSGSDVADSASSLARLREEKSRLRLGEGPERAELERLREENRNLRERNKALLKQNEGLQRGTDAPMADDAPRIVPVAQDGEALEPLPDGLSEDMIIALGPAVAKSAPPEEPGGIDSGSALAGDEAVLCPGPCPKVAEVPRRCLENGAADGTPSKTPQGEIDVQLFGRREPVSSSDR